jgi:signal transduction histidine kinase
MSVRSVFATASGRPNETRRRRALLVFAVFALILLIINLAGWRVYRAMQGTLDRELGERLKAIATAAADRIDAGSVAEIEIAGPVLQGAVLEVALVRNHFERLRDRLDVADLVLLSLDGAALVDLADDVVPGDAHPLGQLHPEAFAAARSGSPATSALITSLGRHTKAGYAPVTDILDGEVKGVVAVEAGATYFDALGTVGRAVVLGNAASALAVALLGFLLYRVLRLQTEIEETVQRTETLSMMGEMAASVAHEIKNPLGIIRATAERLKKRHGDGAPMFDYIPEEVDRLDRILTTYLDFARSDRGRGDETCDVAQVVDDVFQLAGRDMETAAIEVSRSLPSGHRVAMAPGGLKQVILNLALNARQAMPNGGRLELTSRRDPGWVVVEVSDTGVGIEPGDLGRIFEPFVSGRASGSGLGLSIVRRAVEESGGTITVASAVGSGARFTLRLREAEKHA